MRRDVRNHWGVVLKIRDEQAFRGRNRAFGSRLACAVAALAVGCLFVFALGAAADPPTSLTVTRTDDPAGAGSCPADCSLRQAVAAIADGGTITLPAGDYVLTQGQLLITGNVTIEGDSARTTTIDQTTSGGGRVLELGDGSDTNTVDLSGVTITGGDTASDSGETNGGVGGGVWVDTGTTLDLSQSTVTGNSATNSGGGIDTDGNLSVDSSTINGNSVSGGSPGIGGGVDDFGGTVSITNSTVANNSANDDGGGLYAGADLTLLNDTFALNQSNGEGTANDVGSSRRGRCFERVNDEIFDAQTRASTTAIRSVTARSRRRAATSPATSSRTPIRAVLSPAPVTSRTPIHSSVASQTTAARPTPSPPSPAVRRSTPATMRLTAPRPTSAASGDPRGATATSARSRSRS